MQKRSPFNLHHDDVIVASYTGVLRAHGPTVPIRRTGMGLFYKRPISQTGSFSYGTHALPDPKLLDILEYIQGRYI